MTSRFPLTFSKYKIALAAFCSTVLTYARKDNSSIDYSSHKIIYEWNFYGRFIQFMEGRLVNELNILHFVWNPFKPERRKNVTQFSNKKVVKGALVERVTAVVSGELLISTPCSIAFYTCIHACSFYYKMTLNIYFLLYDYFLLYYWFLWIFKRYDKDKAHIKIGT